MPFTLTMPLSVDETGSLAVLRQDTRAEIGQSVAVLLTTVPGERRCEPAYGTPPMLGEQYAPAIAAAALADHEPRAAGSRITVTGDGTARVRVHVDLDTSERST